MKSQFLIAAAHSGAGKTTVTLGLLRALRGKGYRVQPFKCGPDYIDPIHHRTAAGRDSINLDRFMMSDSYIRGLYEGYGSGADVAITEGVMGLYDGARKMEGSSADLARLLGLPVILVLNAKAMAYTAAAILYGMKHFDPGIRIAGVIFNFVETASHYRLLQEACEDVGVPALGHLPTAAAMRIPSRHLGLDTGEAETAIGAAADHVDKHIDWERLLRVTEVESVGMRGPAIAAAEDGGARGGGVRGTDAQQGGARGGGRTILVARDAAFHFLYPENIRRLEEWGSVHYFSPLKDERLPVKADLIYLPGGYPELYLDTLANNHGLLQQLRSYAAGGGKIIAECGGMMYLGQSIVDEKGKVYPMTGILGLSTSMEKKKLQMGYRTILLDGKTIKGHEFHYSQLTEDTRIGRADAMTDSEVYNARGERVEAPVFYTPRLLASYMHLYWGDDTTLLEKWLLY
jgi:cobyrinic acid a,c-diamide synthase